MHSDKFLLALMAQTGGRLTSARAGPWPPARPRSEIAGGRGPGATRRVLGRLRARHAPPPRAAHLRDYADPLAYLEMEFAVGFAHDEERRP